MLSEEEIRQIIKDNDLYMGEKAPFKMSYDNKLWDVWTTLTGEPASAGGLPCFLLVAEDDAKWADYDQTMDILYIFAVGQDDDDV